MNITQERIDYAARILWTQYSYTQEEATKSDVQQAYYDGLFEMARILLADQLPDFKTMFSQERRDAEQ